MKIICAFDSFKGCMTAKEACHAAASGLRERYPDAEVLCLPMSDGGEGMVECVAEAVGAKMMSIMVHDPLMQPTEARYAVSPDGTTAYMEMAAASGLTLVPEDKRNPMITTTYGVGEMILDAAERGCTKIVMGIGGSATCDGGRGMIECLEGHLLLTAGCGMARPEPLTTVSGMARPEPIGRKPIEIIVASDVCNPLYGENGAAYVFAPQKGATPAQVKLLDEQLRRFARETEAKGMALPDLAEHPGAGAAGGLGYGLMAYLGAKLQSGIDMVLDTIHFDEQIKDADFILTGEGKSDNQTLTGRAAIKRKQHDASFSYNECEQARLPVKVPEGILKRAKLLGIPVHLLSGAIEDAAALQEAGFASVRSINENDPRPLEVLMQKDVAMENMRETLCKSINSIARKHIAVCCHFAYKYQIT